MKNIIHNKITILGSGPAGYTAAIYASRANLNPLLITGNHPGGQLMNTNEIENWPGDVSTITGSELINRLHAQALQFNTKIVSDHIESVKLLQKPFFLLGEKNTYTSDSVIIATGANPRYLGIDSEEFYKGKGVSTCAICDGFFYKEKDIAVVGGGNTAIEEALYLSNVAHKIHLIHRREKFSAEPILIDRLMKKVKEKKIILHLNCTIETILGNTCSVTGLLIKKKILSTINRSTIIISGLFVAIGYIPNTSIFINQLEMKDDYIKVIYGLHGNHTQTSIKGVFAAGDVIDHVYRQAITSSASGCMAALDSERYLNSLCM